MYGSWELLDEFPTKRLYPVVGKLVLDIVLKDLTQEFPTKRLNPVVGKSRLG